MPWTSLIGTAIAARTASRARKLSDEQYWATNAARIQDQTLQSLITHARNTRFGRAHDFKRLSQLHGTELWNAYRQAVPVRDWHGFADDIADMREGTQPDVLWPGLVRDFCQTSGTTAGDKFIPVSAQMMRSNYRASLDIFAHAQRFGMSMPDLFSGGLLFLGGSSDVHTGPGGVRTGDLSGIVTRLIRWPLSQVYLPGKQIALMSDWPAKIDAMAQMCARQDVRMVSGMPSWALVLFEKVLTITGKENIRQVWPNLRLVVHGGVRFEPFAPRFRALWSGHNDADTTVDEDVPNRLELYPASEGFIAIQDLPNDPAQVHKGGRFIQPGLRLNTDIGLAYEFIPTESIEDPEPPSFTVGQVEPGVRYVVVLNTCAGLWRYVLGDVVVFDQTPSMGLLPRLRIVGRHRHFMNAFGENIIVEHIERAVSAAASSCNFEVGEFTAAPIYPQPDRPGRVQLVIELVRTPSNPPDLSVFTRAFDQGIKEQNVDYTTKRTADRGMAPPQVVPVAPGTFHRWMASKGKLGGQHKCPRCANHREYVEGVLSV